MKLCRNKLTTNSWNMWHLKLILIATGAWPLNLINKQNKVRSSITFKILHRSLATAASQGGHSDFIDHYQNNTKYSFDGISKRDLFF